MAELAVGFDARGAQTGAAQFDAAGRRITRRAGVVSRAVRGAGRATMAFGRALTGLGPLIGGAVGFAAATKTIQEFEATMVTLRGVTRATGEELAKLEETARQFGATTRFSATESAQAMLNLSRGGFSAQQSMAALSGTLNLAQVGLVKLDDAATIIVGTLNAFQLGASQTNKVANDFVVISNRSGTTVSELAEAMRYAGPVASAFGMTVEETSAFIGALGDNNIKASMAGTNLRGIMAALASPTDSAKAAFRSLGISMEQVDVNTNSLVDIMQTLGDANLDVGRATQIFGRRNMAAAIAISRSTDKIKQLTKDTRTYKNEAEEIARLQDKTLQGSFKALKSAVEELFLATGDKGLGGGLKDLVDTATQVVRILAGVEGATEGASREALDWAHTLKELGGIVGWLFKTFKQGFMFVMAGFSGLRLAARKLLSVFTGIARDILDFIGSNELATKVDNFRRKLDDMVEVDKQKFARSMGAAFESLDRHDLALKMEEWGGKTGERAGEAMADAITKKLDERFDKWIASSNAFYERNRQTFDTYHENRRATRFGPTAARGHGARGADFARIENVNNRMAREGMSLQELVQLDPRFSANNTQGAAELNAQLEAEIALIGKSAQERERLNAVAEYEQSLREAGLPFVKELTAQYDAQYQTFQRLTAEYEKKTEAEKRAKREQSEQQRLYDRVGTTAADAFGKVITGAMSAADAVKSLTQSLLQLILKKAALEPLADMIGGLLGGIFSPAGTGPKATGFGAIYTGGRRMAAAQGMVLRGDTLLPGPGGSTIRAGERAPGEAFLPLGRNKRGELSVKTTGGAGTTIINKTVHVHVHTNQPKEFGRNQRQLTQAAQAAMQGI